MRKQTREAKLCVSQGHECHWSSSSSVPFLALPQLDDGRQRRQRVSEHHTKAAMHATAFL